jgi:hypothetical protein
VLVPVPAGLLQQDDLVDTRRLERAHVGAEVGGCADAARLLERARQGLGAGRVGPERAASALRLELLEQPRAAGHRIVGHQPRYGEAEELEALLPAPGRLCGVLVQ